MFHLDNTPFAGHCRLSFLLVCLVIFSATAVLAEEYDGEEEETKVYKPKLWFLKEARVGGFVLPLSPLSMFTILIVSINVVLNWGTYKWCEASHILVKVHSPEAKQALKELKDEIGSDYKRFAEMAKKHSECPSSRK